MDDWELRFARESSSGAPGHRQRRLGLFIVAVTALATLAVILWLVTRELGTTPLKY
jgi:hypothetical protein